MVFPDLEPDATTEGSRARRGFRECEELRLTAEELADAEAFRSQAMSEHPEWYGATKLKVTEGPIVTPQPLATILASPVTEHVIELDMTGREVQIADVSDVQSDDFVLMLDLEIRPTIHPRMVDELAGMRECRRLNVLDLRNNDLDNDSLRALAASPHFIRLKTLRLSEGNRFRGRVWQQVLEKFGNIVE